MLVLYRTTPHTTLITASQTLRTPGAPVAPVVAPVPLTAPAALAVPVAVPPLTTAVPVAVTVAVPVPAVAVAPAIAIAIPVPLALLPRISAALPRPDTSRDPYLYIYTTTRADFFPPS